MRISEKEKAQLGYSRPPQSPYSDHNSSPKTSNRSSDIDFSDVFGGPPKRASLQDTQSRYSGESSRGGVESNDDTSPGQSSWTYNRGEKPVFGSETRRYSSGGFFDDIFRGDESLTSSPRMDPNSSAAGSRIVSPTRPLPAGVELLGFPAEPSFPPTLESSNSLSNSMGRNSGKVVQNHGVIQGGDPVSSSRWGPLSHSVSSKDEELRKNIMEDESCSGAQVLNGGGIFHFSIHKWASKGVPLVMSLGKGNSLRSKDKNELERSLSLSGSAELEIDALVGEVQPPDSSNDGFPSLDVHVVSAAKERKESDQIVDREDTEPSSKLTTDVNCKSSRWGNSGVSRNNRKPAPISTKKEENIQSFYVNCRLDSSPKVEENHISDRKQSHCNNAHEPGEGFSRMDEDLGSTLGLGSEAWSTSVDDTYENFLIEELPEVADKSTESNENHEDIQILESKILKWSKGKEGNIRALLSTLQYVLWPNSGWKPVPLVDIIEANAAKRSYQRALLLLHPDKLQQKGAVFHHKFIAEKVFDILQEAWDHFNTLGSL